VTTRAALLLVALVVGIAAARGDEPPETKTKMRVVEGIVVAGRREPVQGARVFFAQPEQGVSFVEDATATTNAQGRYSVDLGKFPWSMGTMKAVVLAPGYKTAERTVEAVARAANVDFELSAQPWKVATVRVEDGSGLPVGGVEVTCLAGHGVIWARPKTDTEGRCQIAIPPELGMGVIVHPEGAVPVETYIGSTADDPASITLPVLPALRGRVLDPEGQPVPDVTIGRWITFDTDGAGEMLPFPDGARAVTDRDGGFVIAPKVTLLASDLARPRRSRPDLLCFADPSFRRIAFRVFDRRTRAIEPMEVTLGPTRRVRVPITRGSVVSMPGAVFEMRISIVPRSDIPDLNFFLITRETTQKGRGAGPAEGPVIEEYLPEGAFRLDVNLQDENTYENFGAARRELVVPKGDAPLDLPPLELELPLHQKMVGKPAPEFFATDLETGRPVKLADFRGKVVVLDFWGYWCGPCVLEMPHLIELRRKFEGRPLAIVAMHDQSVQSRAEYDRKIDLPRQRVWGGRDLPFRVLLDRPDPKKSEDRDPEGTGMTVNRYGIEGFPTLFVIDQDGTMVGRVRRTERDRLEALIRELVEKAEAR
jgi:thiol-disulfide isomerase/thioredoxin